MELIIKLILSYFLGSISGSMLLGKLKGIDIREMGSGNAGGTNAFRTMGGAFSLGVLFIDILKGFISVKFVSSINLDSIITTNTTNLGILHIICGTGVILGHVYPLYHGFKGGKGAGTMVGVLMVLFPLYLLIGIPIWLAILSLSGYVGLSTMIAGITLPICTHIFYLNGIYSPFGYFSLMVAAFIIYTHRSNIHRMMNGNENRFEKIMVFRRNKKN